MAATGNLRAKFPTRIRRKGQGSMKKAGPARNAGRRGERKRGMRYLRRRVKNGEEEKRRIEDIKESIEDVKMKQAGIHSWLFLDTAELL